MDAKKFQMLDFVILMILVFAGCLIGKLVMAQVSDTILGFNIPAIGILVIGELAWLKIREMLVKEHE